MCSVTRVLNVFECVLPVSKDCMYVGFGLVLARPSQNKLICSKRALLFVEEWRQNSVVFVNMYYVFKS